MLPTFRYHPDPLGTHAFLQGEPRECQGKDKKLWMRKVVLVLAGVMILGAILLPLL